MFGKKMIIPCFVLGLACSFSLGWWFGKPKLEPEPEVKYLEFEYRELHKHTHEGGVHRGKRTYTPVWEADYDFQYDRQGTHTHKHSESSITLTHGHWRLDKPDTEPETFGTVIGLDHTHSTLNTLSTSRYWRSSNGDWVHDHFYDSIPQLRTQLFITHSHL